MNLELKLFLTKWNNFSLEISSLDTYLINFTWHIWSFSIYNLFLIISVLCCWCLNNTYIQRKAFTFSRFLNMNNKYSFIFNIPNTCLVIFLLLPLWYWNSHFKEIFSSSWRESIFSIVCLSISLAVSIILIHSSVALAAWNKFWVFVVHCTPPLRKWPLLLCLLVIYCPLLVICLPFCLICVSLSICFQTI